MLPKINRLVKSEEITRVWKDGRYFRGKSVNFKILRNRHLSVSRFAFIVSNKITKKAVWRNKIKRKLRAIIQKKLNSLKSGYDILILAQPEILDWSYQAISEEVDKILKKARLSQ